ncbi:MAG: site-specific integrase [Armatimonadota bacterium]|nr:site-specific integrase [bacterium]
MSGYIRQRAPGSWTIQWYLGLDENGKRRYKSKTMKGTKKAAQAELNRIVHELERGTYVEPAKMSITEFLRRWLRDYASGSVSGTTYERYEGIVEQHLIPALGSIPLEKLQPIHVQEYYTEARKSGRVKRILKSGEVKEGGLSPRSVQQHHAVLRKALKCAVRWQLVGRNVADMVDPPRVESKERPSFTEDEVRALLRATDGTPYGPIILIAAATGMRLGEIIALTWADLDVNAGAIAVTKSVEQTKEGLRVKEPKSAKGRRLVPIPANVVNRLQAYQEQQEAMEETAGELWADNNLICPDDLGRYRKPDSISSSFRDMVKKAGVRKLGFHALRHAHASMLANRGHQAKVIQERLGHSTIAVTMDIYSHVLPTTQQDAADSIADIF